MNVDILLGVAKVWVIRKTADIREGETTSGRDYPPDASGRHHPKVEDRPDQRRHRLCIQGPCEARKSQ